MQLNEGNDDDVHQQLLPSSMISDDEGNVHDHILGNESRTDTYGKSFEDPESMRFVYMGIWTLCFSVLYWTSRVLSKIGLPYDGINPLDGFDLFESFSRCLAFTVLLGWYTRISEHKRFAWLFHRRRWYFFVLLITTIPLFSLISNINSLHYGSRDIDSWPPLMWTVSIAGLLVVSVAIGWHVLYAFARMRIPGAIVYLLARVAVIGFYCLSYCFLRRSRHSQLHVHHYFAAWCLALFAEFNHPASAVLLSIMSAIFIQGIGAYTFAPVFNDPTCWNSVPTSSAICTFVSDSNFTIDICFGAFGAVPRMQCYGPVTPDVATTFAAISNHAEEADHFSSSQ